MHGPLNVKLSVIHIQSSYNSQTADILIVIFLEYSFV